MFESEFIKSMSCNFERIKLEDAPEEKRYQYCIISRGGITGLLPCSLRFINGESFLYYDITSKQSLGQMFHKKTINRQWLKDFVWNMKRISMELGRFLLDEANIIWFPDQIYQELGDNRWNFLYFPYYKGENGFRNLLEFMIEKIDYEDSALVDCVYKIYEQYDNFGDSYLKEKIYTDIAALEETQNEISACEKSCEDTEENTSIYEESAFAETVDYTETEKERAGEIKKYSEQDISQSLPKAKKGLLSFLEGARKKDKEARERQRLENHYLLDNGEPMHEPVMVAEKKNFYHAGNTFGRSGIYENVKSNEDDMLIEEVSENVAEETDGIGKTVYMESVAENTDDRRRIYDSEGKMLRVLQQDSVVIGKKSGEADVIINNSSVSRIHARIYYSNGEYLIEDLNSTNGTFKNGLRLKPYEKRKLAQGDEIKLGSVPLMYG